MFTWSTDTVRARERFSLWHDVVCQTLFNVATESPPERFSARIIGRSFGAIRFAAIDADRHEIVRNRHHVARLPEDSYLISLQLRGQSRISQVDENMMLDPGEIAIFDGQRLFHIEYPESVSRIIAVVPHAMVDQRAPWLRSHPLRKITSTSPFFEFARRHLLQLAIWEPNMSESEATLLTDNLCNLIALATARDGTPGRLPQELEVEAMLAFCQKNLHDAELSPHLVATHFGISVRTLHLQFAKFGQSFGRWLLKSRLDACSKTLRDPHQRNCSISEIAYRWGFNDLSHFNKSFRAHFDMSPSQWRSRSES